MAKKQANHSQAEMLDQLGKAWSGVANHVSHLLVTKMAILRMKDTMLQEVLPELLTGYRLAVENHLMPGEVKKHYLAALADSLNLTDEIEPVLKLIDSLNVYCSQLSTDSKDTCLISARCCVDGLLKNYPFKSDQRGLVQADCVQDFEFKSSPVFMEVLLKHLLDNALASIEKAGKGSINIWLSQEDKQFVLNFKDTGLGMTELACSQVFDRFFSERDHNIVPGLGFCRLALMHAGGEMTCHAIAGDYTHFILKFLKP